METQPNYAFFYGPGDNLIKYYPEFIDDNSTSSSQGLSEDDNGSERGSPKLPEVNNKDPTLPKHPEDEAKAEQQKNKTARTREDGKAKISPSMVESGVSKSAGEKALPSKSEPRDNGKPHDLQSKDLKPC